MQKITLTARIPSVLLRSLFFFYRAFLAPLLLVLTGTPSLCRFQPTCSAYAQEAIARHSWRGLLLAVGRVLRCRPTILPLPSHTPKEQEMRWDPVPIKLTRRQKCNKTASTKKLNI